MTYISALGRFVAESNRIEGITRPPTPEEITAHAELLRADSPAPLLAVLQHFVSVVQPGAVLRDREGLNVRIGSHYPPPGGLAIPIALTALLINSQHGGDPYLIHRAYQNLHPFTDGNGRSGRALWLRTMGGPARVPLGFLHTWYYQSLSDGDRK